MGRKRTSNRTSLKLSVDKDLLANLKSENINLSALFTQCAKSYLSDVPSDKRDRKFEVSFRLKNTQEN